MNITQIAEKPMIHVAKVGKPAVIVRDVDIIDEYSFSAAHPDKRSYWICSNSLSNLKNEIRSQGWTYAWITRWDGDYFCISQVLTTEIRYAPRY